VCGTSFDPGPRWATWRDDQQPAAIWRPGPPAAVCAGGWGRRLLAAPAEQAAVLLGYPMSPPCFWARLALAAPAVASTGRWSRPASEPE